MITEDYVSFKLAKLLKEKKFDESCNMGYNEKEQLVPLANWRNTTLDKFEGVSTKVTAPTLQRAMKWLREVHNIIPVILIGGYTVVPFYYWFRIDKINNGKWEDSVYRNETECNTYEEACEAAIKYCLENLI